MTATRHTVTDLLVVLSAIAVLGTLTQLVGDSLPRMLLHAVGAALVVGYAIWRGYSTEDLGLARESVPAGLHVGVAVSAIIVAGVTIAALLPVGREFFGDDRFIDVSSWEAVYEIAVRIPFVTALFEELLFRSVLLAVLLSMTSTRRAVAWASFAFGLWHVPTTLSDLDGNEVTDSFDGLAATGAVAAVVVVTGAAGVVFSWARLRSNSIVAPWLIHVAFNASAFTAGLLLAT